MGLSYVPTGTFLLLFFSSLLFSSCVVAKAHTVLSFTFVSCQDMNVHASGMSGGGAVLGLRMLHTSLVKPNIKMRRKKEGEGQRIKGEEPCLILWDVRVWRWDVGMCSVLHGSENSPN